MKTIGNIYLIWRKGKGHPRHQVGVIKRNVTQGVRFSYIKEGVEAAVKDGFQPYTEFPDVNRSEENPYTVKVLEAFSQRLVRTERSDSSKYYDFWRVDSEYMHDKYYLLAKTQGLLPTDNFEFLADYNLSDDLCFVSELAHLSERKHKSGIVKVGDELTYRYEPNNSVDSKAVLVYKDDIELGYIKIVHNRIFHKNGRNLKLKVVGIDQNGIINRIFVSISY